MTTSGVSRAAGLFTNCGPGVDTYELSYNCGGPACSSITGFQNVKCNTDGGEAVSCSNDVKCPPNIMSFQSNFTFEQNAPDPIEPAPNEFDNLIKQHQNISVASCARFSVTSDGTEEGTKVDGGGKEEGCPMHVQETPSKATGSSPPKSTSAASSEPSATSSSGSSSGKPGEFQGASSRSRPSKQLLFFAMLFSLMVLLPGVQASAIDNHRREDLRDRAKIRVRAVSDKVRTFAENFGNDLASRANAQGENGETFAHNLVADVISSVCGGYFNGESPASFSPPIVGDCIKSIYGGDKLPQPGTQFYAVFGASLLCDYTVSEAYPVGEEFFADGCEGLQDLAQKIFPSGSIGPSNAPSETPPPASETAANIPSPSAPAVSNPPASASALSNPPASNLGLSYSASFELETSNSPSFGPSDLSVSIDGIPSATVAPSVPLGMSRPPTPSIPAMSNPPVSNAPSSEPSVSSDGSVSDVTPISTPLAGSSTLASNPPDPSPPSSAESPGSSGISEITPFSSDTPEITPTDMPSTTLPSDTSALPPLTPVDEDPPSSAFTDGTLPSTEPELPLSSTPDALSTSESVETLSTTNTEESLPSTSIDGLPSSTPEVPFSAPINSDSSVSLPSPPSITPPSVTLPTPPVSGSPTTLTSRSMNIADDPPPASDSDTSTSSSVSSEPPYTTASITVSDPPIVPSDLSSTTNSIISEPPSTTTPIIIVDPPSTLPDSLSTSTSVVTESPSSTTTSITISYPPLSTTTPSITSDPPVSITSTSDPPSTTPSCTSEEPDWCPGFGCTYLTGDPLNCGSCNNTCDYMCSEGQCVCPEGQTFSNETYSCVDAPSSPCPPNSTWVEETNECICPEGQTFNNETNTCDDTTPSSPCPPASVWNPATNYCTCRKGKIYNNETNTCDDAPPESPCPPNSTWIEETQECTCPENETWVGETGECAPIEIIDPPEPNCTNSEWGDSWCPEWGCVFFDRDIENCGSCNFACEYGCANATCTCPELQAPDESGKCVNVTDGEPPKPTDTCTDEAYPDWCYGTCVDLQWDNNNCGKCGSICDGECDDWKCYPSDDEPTSTPSTPKATPSATPAVALACYPACEAGQSCTNGTCIATQVGNAGPYIIHGLEGEWR